MDEDEDEDNIRELHAELSAQRFLLEIVLANLIGALAARGDADRFIADVLRVGSKTEHLTADDDFGAEVLADLAVRTQQKIEHIVARAKERAGLQ